jgi:hypothetical protein
MKSWLSERIDAGGLEPSRQRSETQPDSFGGPNAFATMPKGSRSRERFHLRDRLNCASAKRTVRLHG